MASGGSEEPLLRDEDVPQEPPTGKRRSSIDVVEAGAPTTPQLTAPLSGWAARVYAYRACFFVMAAMTGVSFVYGGFSAVVAVYLHDDLDIPEQWATFAVNVFGFVNFSMAIVGGLLSDRVLGQYHTVVFGTVCNICGAALLIITTKIGLGSLSTLRIVTGFAMLGVAMGNGICATVLSTFIGTQYRGHPSQLPSVYRWFYITFNSGVVISSLGVPALTAFVSPSDAFVVLGFCAVGALLLFVAGTKFYTRSTLVTVAVTPSPAPKHWNPTESPRFSLASLRKRTCCRVPKVTAREKRKLMAVVRIFLPFVVFWALFFNIYGFWTFSAVGMNRYLGSYEIPAGQLTALNPLIDICIIPIFDLLVYPTFERVMGRPMSPIARMTVGMCFTAMSLLAAGIVQSFNSQRIADGTAPLHVAWQIPQYFFLSCGEVMSSITGLEFAFTQAPDGFRGAVMAGWYLTQAAGNAVVAIVALVVHATSDVSPWVYFGYAAAMVVCTFGFRIVSKGYHYQKQQRRRTRRVPAPRRGPPVKAPSSSQRNSTMRAERLRSVSVGSAGSM